MTVLSGGLAPATDDGTNIAPITFLTDMYGDGAKGSFDALGYHAYSAPTLPDTYSPSSGWSQMNQTSPSLRSVMTANGDGAKQIWITEVGAPSAGPMGVGTTGQAQEVTEATQGAKSTPWIGAEFFYTYQDAATNPDFYGLRNADGSPKPAWTALAAALSRGGSTAPPPVHNRGVAIALVAGGAAVLAVGTVGVGLLRGRARRQKARKNRGRHRRTSPYRRARNRQRQSVPHRERVTTQS